MPIPGAPSDSPNPLGDLFANVNRPQLNAFVANSQARNGLLSAQTQEAMIKAAQAQEEQGARENVYNDLIGMGAKPSEAMLGRDIGVGALGNAEVMAKALGMFKLGYGDPASQVAGQQMAQGKVAGPIAQPTNYFPLAAPPGGSALQAPQQSPQGAAQTAMTKAVSVKDIADAEAAHSRAVNQTSGASALDPGTVDMAARVVMADPTKMNSYAGFGQAGQANKNAINNKQAALLTAAGMTPEDMIRQRAIGKASIGGAAQAAKQAETLDAFMPLVKANGNRISQLLDQIDAAGGPPDEPIVNGFARMLGRNLGSDDLAELHSVFTAYQMEVARLLTAGPSMNGVISDHARGDVQGMAPENMTASQARRVLNRIDIETGIRRQGVQSALEGAANAQLPVISGGEGTAPPPAAAGASTPEAPVPLDQYLKSKGF